MREGSLHLSVSQELLTARAVWMDWKQFAWAICLDYP